MKYLKKFEAQRTLKYKVGDYILLDMDKVRQENKEHGFIKVPDDVIGKIILISSGYYPYLYETYTTNTFMSRDFEIIRKLTTEEISEYEIKKTAGNYNL